MTSYKTGFVIFLFQSPDRNLSNKVTAQTKTSEINPRVKLLTVEGIQKRKNPDKNYVSNCTFYYFPYFHDLYSTANSRCFKAMTSKLLTFGVKFLSSRFTFSKWCGQMEKLT